MGRMDRIKLARLDAKKLDRWRGADDRPDPQDPASIRRSAATGCAVNTWTVVYQGTRRREIVEEGIFSSATFRNFDKSAKAGRLNERAVTGMWIVDHSTCGGRIVRRYERPSKDRG